MHATPLVPDESANEDESFSRGRSRRPRSDLDGYRGGRRATTMAAKLPTVQCPRLPREPLQ
jgi:hypothetical protein